MKRRQIDKRLQRCGVPPYLRAVFTSIAPEHLHEQTFDIVVTFVMHLAQLPPGPLVRPLEDFSSGRLLRELWSSDGGSVADLLKFFAMVSYRNQIAQDRLPSNRLLPAELEEFWLAGGHDLTELAAFLGQAETETLDWLPK